MKNNHFIILFIVFFCSCGVGGNALKKYVEDEANGLVQTITFDDVHYKMTYRPNTLAYVYEMRGEKPDKASFDTYMDENKNTSLFILDITFQDEAKQAVADFSPIKEAYQNTLNGNNFLLVENGQRSSCVIYHCETMGKGKYKVSILFDKNAADIQSDWTVSFRDVITGHSPQFNFKQADIKNIPTLKL